MKEKTVNKSVLDLQKMQRLLTHYKKCYQKSNMPTLCEEEVENQAKMAKGFIKDYFSRALHIQVSKMTHIVEY